MIGSLPRLAPRLLSATEPPAVMRSQQEPTDGELVARVLSGDRVAAEALYRRHVDEIDALVTRLLSNRADAEEVVQETFAIALDRLGRLREPAAVRGWIAQIAVHQVHRRYRRRRLLRAFG